MSNCHYFSYSNSCGSSGINAAKGRWEYVALRFAKNNIIFLLYNKTRGYCNVYSLHSPTSVLSSRVKKIVDQESG